MWEVLEFNILFVNWVLMKMAGCSLITIEAVLLLCGKYSTMTWFVLCRSSILWSLVGKGHTHTGDSNAANTGPAVGAWKLLN